MEHLLIETHLPVWQALFLGAGCGLLLTFITRWSRLKAGERLKIERAVLEERLSTMTDSENRLRGDYETLQQQVVDDRLRFEQVQMDNARLKEKADHLVTLELHYESLQLRYQNLLKTQTESDTLLESERHQHEDKVRLLSEARESLSQEFKLLANEILEEKSKRFVEQNETHLSQLLNPLKERIQAFKGKVEEVYVKEGQDRSALAEQVRHLLTLNQQLSSDATNLTQALKGQSKVQGNWGELILERVLDASGLTEGLHYRTQESHQRDDGSRAQPDVIIHLPEQRHLVIDAKVSLLAYEAYCSVETDVERAVELKRHLESVRSHIKGLASRQYQDLYQLNSLDFVIMFIPVEPAFMLAIAGDEDLWREAWEKNVLLVSPSTLLFVVRTVSHLWRQEQQSRNAQEIARQGGDLYDKLCGFVHDLESIGKNLEQAQGAYTQAFNKLKDGRGNLLGRAEKLRKLGVKSSKTLPATLLDLDEEDLDAREEGRDGG